MHGWVQVLMAETATLFIPEGLEDYAKKPEPDASSVLSFSVLKQWVSGDDPFRTQPDTISKFPFLFKNLLRLKWTTLY